MGEFQAERGVPPLGLSIKQTAKVTGESEWTVKQKLRDGTYRAKKSGRRTIVIYQTVVEHWDSLPDAKFCKPLRRKHTEHEASA